MQKNLILAGAAGIVMIALIGTEAATFIQLRSAQAQQSALASQVASQESELQALLKKVTAATAQGQTNGTSLEQILSKKDAPAPLTSDQNLTAAVAKSSPAVVSIMISKDIGKQKVGAGSGFLVTGNGFVVTNKHVVLDQNAEYTVLLSTGEQMPAKVVYRDHANDLAVLKIDGLGYKTVSLGDSSAVQLGQRVIAIGNALGEYSNSVSTGIISGLNRSIQASTEDGGKETLSNVMQTDTAINPGNSGGPLIDTTGKVIGITVATVVGSNNISFAIPINAAKAVLHSLLGL